MKKTLLWFLVISLVVSIILIGNGCQKATAATTVEITTAETTATATTSAETTAAATAEEEVKSLTVWLNPNHPKGIDDMFKRFTVDTGINLDIVVSTQSHATTVLMKWNAGERPDILQWYGTKSWLSQIRPLETLIDLSDLDFVEKTIPNLLDFTTKYENKVFGAVVEHPIFYGVWYNKKIFEQNSMELPNPANWDEFLEICAQLKKVGITPLTSGGATMWPLQVYPSLVWADTLTDEFMKDLNSNKAQWTDPNIIIGIEKLKELQDLGYLNEDILTAKYEDEQKRLINGDTAMVAQLSSMISLLVDLYGMDSVNENIGYFPISLESKTPGWQVLHAFYVPKTGNTAKEKAAIKFINYVTGEGYQELVNGLNGLPTLEGFEPAEQISMPIKDAYTIFQEGDVRPVFNMMTAVHYGPFETFLNDLIAGTKTPEEVGKALENEFEKNAKALGLEGF